MALTIRLAAMSGWAMNAACDPPLTDSTVAFIRLAMNRSQSGGMAWSCSETMYQVGDSDPMILPHYSYLLAGLIPQARVKIYSDSAHGFLFQHHAEFAADVAEFLS